MPFKAKGTAVQLKQSSTYCKRKCKLQRQFEEQRGALESAKNQLRLANERDKILLDLCLHQELLAHILSVHQQQLQLQQQHDDGRRQPEQGQGSSAQFGVGAHWQQQQQQQQACTSASSHAAHDGSGLAAQSYTARLLREATPQQLRRVQAMSVQAWMTFFQDVFINLLVHLEFLSRSEAGDEDKEPPPPPDPDQLTAMLASSSQQSVPELHPSLHLSQLECLVDEAVTLVLLSYLHNHLPMLEACAHNIATQQPAVAPPGHWQRVAQRMKLSRMQVEHFQIVLDEAARLSKAENSAAAEIVQRAASPSLLLATAAHMQRHAGSASGRGSASASGSGSADAGPHTAPAAAEAEAGDGDGLTEDHEDRINSQLRRHVRSRILQLRMAVMCYFNTFSRLQIAQLCVYSFPFLPSITEVARAACQLQQQRDRAASAGGDGADLQPYTQAHLAQRSAVLQEQQQRWWQQHC